MNGRWSWHEALKPADPRLLSLVIEDKLGWVLPGLARSLPIHQVYRESFGVGEGE